MIELDVDILKTTGRYIQDLINEEKSPKYIDLGHMFFGFKPKYTNNISTLKISILDYSKHMGVEVYEASDLLYQCLSYMKNISLTKKRSYGQEDYVSHSSYILLAEYILENIIYLEYLNEYKSQVWTKEDEFYLDYLKEETE